MYEKKRDIAMSQDQCEFFSIKKEVHVDKRAFHRGKIRIHMPYLGLKRCYNLRNKTFYGGEMTDLIVTAISGTCF